MEPFEVWLCWSSRDNDLGSSIAAVVGSYRDAKFVDHIVGVAVSAHYVSRCDGAAERETEVGCIGL